jgi:hypothetical protein
MAIYNFFENSQSYSQLKVHHCTGVVHTGGKLQKSSSRKVLNIQFERNDPNVILRGLGEDDS